MQIRIKKQ